MRTRRARKPTQRYAQIENCTSCNLSCWFCQNRFEQRPPSRFMDMVLFDQILDAVESVYTRQELNLISFATYNEPMLDPGFVDKVRRLYERSFFYFGFTNGTRFTRETVEALADLRPPVSFVVNLPTIDPVRYREVVDRQLDVSKVIEEIRYMTRRLHGKHLIDVNGAGDSLHHREAAWVERTFADCRNVRVRKIRIVDRAGMLNPAYMAAAGHPGALKPVTHSGKIVGCRAKKLDNLFFGVNGNLFLCCHDYHQKYSVGNIRETPLKELLNSGRYHEALFRMSDEFCRHCDAAVTQPAGTLPVLQP